MSIAETLVKGREANAKGACAYCWHSPMKLMRVIGHDETTELFGLCDERCWRYWCFELNPKAMKDR